MAFPFKTGGDFYNCEAQRMRLHNLGANPTETATGLMYFNTGASNLGKHAVVHDGTNFKALAFVDEIATNAEFVELKEKVDLLIGDDVDTDTIIDSWKDVQAFLKDIEDTKTLQGMLSSYLPLSGGTIESSGWGSQLTLKRSATTGDVVLGFANSSKMLGYLGFNQQDIPFYMSVAGATYALLHSGNIESQNAGSATKLATARTIWGQSFDGTRNITNPATMQYLSFANTGSDVVGYIGKGGTTNNTIYVANYTADGLVRLFTNNNINNSLILNSSGNVTIGGEDLAGEDANDKLFVAGGAVIRALGTGYGTLGQRMTNSLIVGHENFGLQLWCIDTGHVFGQVGYTRGSAEKAFNLILQHLGGNVLIGTPSEIKSGAKLQIKGDVYVDGNIIATKEVSAGGAGTEGESGDGGAEVIDKELAKGQSSYTITNTIGRSAVAVSLYEWNANNGSWDMCLADISVKNDTITVTFGSATSVNHKLVAVG